MCIRDSLKSDVTALKSDVAVLKSDVEFLKENAMLKTDAEFIKRLVYEVLDETGLLGLAAKQWTADNPTQTIIDDGIVTTD